MSDTYKDKRKIHMERRREHGLTYREMEEEFGDSKSKIHRDMTKKPTPKKVYQQD